MSKHLESIAIYSTFVTSNQTVVLAQSVRAPDCGSGGRGFEPHIPPKGRDQFSAFFVICSFYFSELLPLNSCLFVYEADNDELLDIFLLKK